MMEMRKRRVDKIVWGGDRGHLGVYFLETGAVSRDSKVVYDRVHWFHWTGVTPAISKQEIARAEELGCEIVKLFLGGTYGPSFVKAIRGPQPWTSIMPTGGVFPDKENLKTWFDAGVTCVGMGVPVFNSFLVI
ncbi:hypothetical protein CAPN004_20130 [Capnocytophaga cynodegmi]|nr:hypothetical protein CAPN004_20130 [Capnocytophaga cynodegmi]